MRKRLVGQLIRSNGIRVILIVLSFSNRVALVPSARIGIQEGIAGPKAIGITARPAQSRANPRMIQERVVMLSLGE
jgi:hypothetical protein